MACLYHCDYGDPDRFAQTLNNIGNHYSVYGADPFALQIVLVVHAGGIKFFLDSVDIGDVPKLESLIGVIKVMLDAFTEGK
ncbi:MAG: hypothetical protein E2577_19200, partial [Starkeya sp.]|nr:hypothetical protein [Starkeya sp.]